MATRKKVAPTVTAADARAALVTLLGEQAANALVGAAQVATRQAREIVVVINSGEALKYGVISVGKQGSNGKFFSNLGISSVASGRQFVTDLTEALDKVEAGA